MILIPVICVLQENSGFLLNALLKRGLSEEQPVPDSTLAAPTGQDALKLDAMTAGEPEPSDTVAPNSPPPNSAQLDSVSPEPEIVSRSPGPGSGSGDSLEVEIRSKLSRLVSRGNSKDGVSSDEEDKQTEKESEKQNEKSRPNETERKRQRASVKREKGSGATEQVNGQQMKRAPGLAKSSSAREETTAQEMRLEKRAESFVEREAEKEQKRLEVNRVSKKQCKRDGEKEAAQKGGARRSGSSASSSAVSPSSQEGGLSNNQVRWEIRNTFILSHSLSLACMSVLSTCLPLWYYLKLYLHCFCPPWRSLLRCVSSGWFYLPCVFLCVRVCLCTRWDRMTWNNNRGFSCSLLSCSR